MNKCHPIEKLNMVCEDKWPFIYFISPVSLINGLYLQGGLYFEVVMPRV
jgi:hypothetical protein